MNLGSSTLSLAASALAALTVTWKGDTDPMLGPPPVPPVALLFEKLTLFSVRLAPLSTKNTPPSPAPPPEPAPPVV